MKSYVIDEEIIAGAKALHEFAQVAFPGYGGETGEIEKDMCLRFCWLVEDWLSIVLSEAKDLKPEHYKDY